MMTFGLILEQKTTLGDIYAGTGGAIGRQIGMYPGMVLGYGVGHGSPVGVWLGGNIGAVVGGQVGRYIGRKIPDNPDKLADFSNIAHRGGYLLSTYTKPGAILSDLVTHPYATIVGSNIYNAYSKDGIQKLGYRTKIDKIVSSLIGPGIIAKTPEKK